MDLLARLLAIGFTEYEAKTYLALLPDYPATGYQLSKKSGVPRSMVYEALGRLHVRGAVLETSDGRVSQYRPLPPEVLLDRHQHDHLQLIDELRSGLGHLYTDRGDDRVWSIARRPSVLSYASQMIRQADHELYLVLADADLDALCPQIRDACGRSIGVSALLTGHEELGCGQTARHAPLESELQELTGAMIVVADGQEVLIARSSVAPGHDDVGIQEISTTATITRNPNLVLIARQFVWMELFAQRIYSRLGPDLLAQLDPPDRQVFESLAAHNQEATVR